MNFTKRLIGILIAAVMAVSVLAVPAAALSAETAPTAKASTASERSTVATSLQVDTCPLPYYASDFSLYYLNIYNEMRAAVMNCEPSYTFTNYKSDADTEFILTAMNILILYDSYTYHLDEVSAVASGSRATLKFSYNLDKATYKAGIAAADEAYAELEATFKENDSTATKVKKIHDFVAEKVTYSIEAPDSHSIIGVFTNGEAKCDGYASAFNYLAEKAGISTVFVAGLPTVPKDDYGHAWNRVKIGKSWYVVDITNDDYDDSFGYVLYDYFMISDSEYSRDFKAIDDKYVNEPEATNSKNSYYEQKKLTADTAKSAVAMIQSQAGGAKETPILLEVQVSSDAEYKKLVAALSADTSLFADYINIPGKTLRSSSVSNVNMRTLHIAIREVKK
jgi:hypothetical protein